MTIKPISSFLQQLIDQANEAIQQSQQTIKEKLLYVYNQAKEEGFNPKEARKLMEDKIPFVSDRYMREVLPDEAKNLNMRRLPPKSNSGTSPQILEENKEDNIKITTNPNVIDYDEIDIPPESDSTLEEEQPEPEKPFSSTEFILQREHELQDTQQLLKEERIKNAELLERIEQRDNKIEELDGLTNEQAYKMQELSRRLTEATTTIIDKSEPEGDGDASQYEVQKPKPEHHWSQFLDSECVFCHKVTPWIIRHFISGKEVKWIDRERYKVMYGMVPAE